jgi:hypothetical protein
LKKKFIDGNNLKKNVINHMPCLSKFTFNIRSYLNNCNQIDLPVNEDVKKTFNDFKTNHIISYTDYFPSQRSGSSSIFTYPYTLKTYNDITNNFPGVLCKSVRKITLSDEHPFEHEFFLRISQSFPFVEQLTLYNTKGQKNKLDNQDLSIVKFHHLLYITLIDDAHDDYIEQFLDNTKTFLSNNVHLNVKLEQLEVVTHHFTRDSTRINCQKLKSLNVFSCNGLSASARKYFPHTYIY